MSKARDIADSTKTLDVDGGTIKLDGNYPVGTDNVALGDTALDSNVSGIRVTAIGSQALTANTASDNTAVGARAMLSTTSGTNNTAVGRDAMYSNTTGGDNISLGLNSLFANTTGNYNTALGRSALLSNTTASYNTAVGYQAGYSNTTNQFNTDIGGQAGFTGGNYSTRVGFAAGYLSTGQFNTFVGTRNSANYGCGQNMTTGNKNTIIGGFNGNQDGLDIRTLSNRIVLSDGDGTARLHVTNTGDATWYSTSSNFTARNTNSAATTNAFFTGLYGVSSIASGGTVSLRMWTNGNIQNTNNSYTALSDQKLKENIVDANPQWDDIKALRVRNYNMIEGQTHRQIGLIAQEVETVSAGLVYESPDADENGNDLGTVTKSVNYSVLYMKAVKALQEAMDRIETLEARITALENA